MRRRVEEKVLLFIPITILKHKIQLLPSKEKVANPHRECDLIQNYLTNHNE